MSPVMLSRSPRLLTILPSLHERLLILRMISHDALIVCQTNEQVKPACSFASPEHQPQKLRV
jgi:hypothetical protein